MKLNKKLFVLAGLTLLGGLVTGCSDVSYNSDGIVQIKGDVYAIASTEKTLSYAEINKPVDLGEYFEVVMDDENNTKRHEFTITCDDNSVKIDGHKVTGTKLGDYELRLAVNDKDKYVNFSVKSAYNIELINFFNKFQESDGKNYRIDLGDYDESTKEFDYGGGTYLHNENYVAIFNAEDPGEVDKNGEADSTILANLSDGNAYWGYFNKDEKPVFENGKTRLDNYYIGLSLSLDGTSFSSIYDDVTSEEMLVGDAKQAEAFLNYGMSSFPKYSGYTTNGFYVLGLVDGDGDGTKDTLYAEITVDGPSATDKTKVVKNQTWCTVKISEVGTSRWDTIETAINDASYVPAKIDSSEVKTAFEKLAEGNNYTTTITVDPLDNDEKIITDPTKVDDTSAIAILTGYKAAFTEKNYVVDANNIAADAYLAGERFASIASWKDGDKSYFGQYIAGETESEDKISKVEDTDGKYLNVMKSYTVSSVDTSTIADVDWKKKVPDGSTITFTGDIGDDADGEKTNGFFEGLFNQVFALGVTLTSGDTYAFGTYLTMDGTVQYSDGSTCSYTVSSSYDSVKVDTSTNEITIDATIYLPFSSLTQNYAHCSYTISDIGSTSYDFSTFKAAAVSTAE